MSDETYCYAPDFTVLRNSHDIRDQDALDRLERGLVRARVLEPMPLGDFDLAHLQAIHHHLFQDIYKWAGEIRTVDISKGGSQFQPKGYIEMGMGDVHRRILKHDYMRGLDTDAFSNLAGEVIGDVNYVHPFREGNGRTQLYFFKQLATKAGHDVDLTQIKQDDWMAASHRAHQGDYTPMSKCLSETIQSSSRAQTRNRNIART